MSKKDKIITMSQLAKLDQTHIKKDLKITSHYLEDYVYINNMITRMSLVVLMVIGCGIHLLLSLEHEILVPTSIQTFVQMYLWPYGSVVVILLVLYTLFSTQIYKKRYQEAQVRVNKYRQLLKKLESLEQHNGEKGKNNAK